MKYSTLADFYQKLETSSSRLEKTHHVAKLFGECDENDIEVVVYFVQGRIFPIWDIRNMGISTQTLIKALAKSYGSTEKSIIDAWKKEGDLGEVAALLAKEKRQATLFQKSLSVRNVYQNLVKLSTLSGTGTVNLKIGLVSELLTSATPLEAKYLARQVLEDLRVGVGEGVLRDALVWAYFPKVLGVFTPCKECGLAMPQVPKCLECSTPLKIAGEAKNKLTIDSLEKIPALGTYHWIESQKPRELYDYLCELVQRALDITNDVTKVALLSKQRDIVGLKSITITLGHPMKVMLFQKAKNMTEAFLAVGKPCAFEYKYDGFRVQIHKDKNKVLLFTRRLEEVTSQFPDVVTVAREHLKADSCLVDCEVIGVDPKTGKWRPFQEISQRIRRKYDIEELIKKLPVIVNAFDLIALNGKSFLETPFQDRRTALAKLVKTQKDKIVLAEQIITDNEKEAEDFYKKALAFGNEGIMAKNLSAPYKPGSRVGYGQKIKPTMETLDLVIVGAEWGTGKRGKWMSSFVVACQHVGEYVEIGRVGTGFKEKSEEGLSFDELTQKLIPLVIKENGKEVTLRPSIVLEISYEEIQKSTSYSSGFALRFPRVLRLRDDKSPEECSDLEVVRQLYESQ